VVIAAPGSWSELHSRGPAHVSPVGKRRPPQLRVDPIVPVLIDSEPLEESLGVPFPVESLRLGSPIGIPVSSPPTTVRLPFGGTHPNLPLCDLVCCWQICHLAALSWDAKVAASGRRSCPAGLVSRMASRKAAGDSGGEGDVAVREGVDDDGDDHVSCARREWRGGWVAGVVGGSGCRRGGRRLGRRWVGCRLGPS
jgi:hypothetical protein